MGKALFITATDTEVGKTFITAGLCRAYRNKGYSVGCSKPIATGEAISSDAIRLKEASRCSDPIEIVNPILLKQPIAPYNAALMESRTIDIPALVNAIKNSVNRHDITFIEGVGGLMVPIATNYLILDLIAELGYPVLVVAPARLGTVNHTLMTTALLRARGIDTIGIILNLCLEDNIITDSSAQALNEFAPVPIIAKISYNKAYQKNYDFLAQSLENKIDMNSLFNRIGT